jgi:hypothetical protein
MTEYSVIQSKGLAGAFGVDRVSAKTALEGIARVEARTARATVYGASSAITILWGIAVILANLADQFLPGSAGPIWLAAWTAGLAGTVFVGWRWRGRSSEKPWTGLRLAWAQAVLILFGSLLVWLLPIADPRQLAAFWPLLFMMAFVIAGLWLGRFFVLCGILVSALTVVAYLYGGAWLPLWMAAVNGGALVAGGLYLRKVGLRP